jgi:N-acetylneuraminic acid mutarotase
VRANPQVRARLLIAAVAGLAGLGAVVAIAAPEGGDGPGAETASAKRWRTLERSPLKRTEVAAARIGRYVYVVGGFLQPGGETTNRVARYDIREDRWRLVRPMPIAVNHPAATAEGGKLYVHGGFASATGLEGATNRLFEYSPGANRWTELPSSAVSRAAHALGAIAGKLYAAGGANSSTDQLTSLEIYDIGSGTWAGGADMGVGRNHVAAAVVDGLLYVLGGRPPGLSVVERYDPATDAWTTLAPMNTARSGFVAVVVGVKIVVFGGEELIAGGQTIEQVEIYNPGTDNWGDLPDMRTPRHGLGGASKGGRVFALEGGPEPGFSFSRTLEFLDVR